MTVVSHKKTVEKIANTGSGGFLLILGLAGFLGAAWLFFQGIMTGESGGDGLMVVTYIIGALVVTIVSILLVSGLYSLQQNESAAITLFGNYKGTDKRPGLRWVIPWYSRKKISLRVRNVT
jgi:regulator of protease activity HflC (stomatin/prohibitin superfamily)